MTNQEQFDRNQRGRFMETLQTLAQFPANMRIQDNHIDAIAWAIERIENLENDVAILAAELDELHDDIAVELLGEDR
ncbi:MAG: hypothetical protein OES34_13165 [Nitrosopumilus sp.]|nr:hypothetical protein [Nitrosopumilus sp.]